MATWIAHLRIAEQLLNTLPEVLPAAFVVGNIAPDSGIPDANWEHFNPPPHVTHFIAERDGKTIIADMDFYRNYLQPARGCGDRLVAFRLGYFFHLVTDALWLRRIDRPTREKYANEFASDKNFIWEVKKDWYGLDFLYVHSHPLSIFWRVFLDVQGENGELDFLPLQAIQQRVGYIQEYYQRTGIELQNAKSRPYTYLTQHEMDGFVSDAAGYLLRIYQYLWITGDPAGDLDSAIDLSL